MLHFTPDVQVPCWNPIFTTLEKVQLKKLGASQTQEGKRLVPDERQILSNPPFREVMTQLYWRHHQGIQVMCNAILRAYLCPQIYSLAKQIIESCLTWRKVNKQVLSGQRPGGRNPGLMPFQSIQMDYTEFPWVGHLKYFLVILDHLTNLVKAMTLFKVPLQVE
jgi:hypothetical protein